MLDTEAWHWFSWVGFLDNNPIVAQKWASSRGFHTSQSLTRYGKRGYIVIPFN